MTNLHRSTCASFEFLGNKRPFWPSLLVRAWELPLMHIRTWEVEDAMKAYFNNLSTKTWLLLVMSLVVAAYPIARLVVPVVLHAVVPEVVRSVLSVI
jgi:hypothetical protein